MGWNGNYPAIEDELCAEYLEGRLRDQPQDFGEMRRRIQEDPQGAKFFDPSKLQFVEGDFHAAMDLNRFSFVLRVVKGEHLRVEKVPVNAE
jgi:phosphosulfolactate phosphohydrolase-like enzyme